ncbi:MAG: JAB domain-containing protein [Firmicutes bacterium]|nr:JAB domain-containing protein [Bacillota bacterium]
MSYLIKDLPDSEKPREKFKKYGSDYLTDEELIAIILRCGTKNMSVKDLAIKIKKEYPNLNDLTLSKLENIVGMGEVKAITLLSAIELGKRCLNDENNISIKFNKAENIFLYFKNKIGHLSQENLIAVFLNNKIKMISYKTIFIGTVNMSITHPREIFKEAINNRAVYIILIHNHPSGDVTPSKADINFTNQVLYTGNIIGIPLLDHLIIGKSKYYSFYDNGDLNEKYIEK